MDQSARFGDVAQRLGASLTGSVELTGGSSATVHRLDLLEPTGRVSVVHREHRAAFKHGTDSSPASKEFEVLQVLHERDLAVPKPLLLDAEHNSLVIDFIAGTSELAGEAADASLPAMADFLTLLHGLDPGELALALIEPLEDPVAALPRYLPDSADGERLGGLLDSYAPTPNPVRLIHGDYWPGNLLWDHGQLVGVIDWEDAALGDPLADLACARVELLCAYGQGAMDALTAEYLARNPLRTDSLPLWDTYVSATALHSMHHWGLAAADEAARRATTTAFFESAVAQLAV